MILPPTHNTCFGAKLPSMLLSLYIGVLLIPYHTCPKLWRGPFYYQAVCLKTGRWMINIVRFHIITWLVSLHLVFTDQTSLIRIYIYWMRRLAQFDHVSMHFGIDMYTYQLNLIRFYTSCIIIDQTRLIRVYNSSIHKSTWSVQGLSILPTQFSLLWSGSIQLALKDQLRLVWSCFMHLEYID